MTGVVCPELDKPENGNVVITSWSPGGTATFTCERGCDLVTKPTGSHIKTCQSDGTWTEPHVKITCEGSGNPDCLQFCKI